MHLLIIIAVTLLINSPLTIDQPTGNLIALTFDDGPWPQYTSSVLATLKKYNVKATFFVLSDSVRKNPDLIKQEIADGHEIGNHTTNKHLRLTGLSDQEVLAEISQAQNTISQYATPKLLRPPYGAHDPRVDGLIKSSGLKMVTWTLDSHDWHGFTARDLTDKVLALARPSDIILFHDIHANTAEALPQIIEGLKARGFTFVTVSQLLATGVRLPSSIEVH